jgi:hypothetical protein
MKRALRALVFVLGLAAGALPAARQATAAGSHPFGLGLVLGEPTGLTAKLYLDKPFALQFGLGWIDDFGNHDGVDVNVDFLWHPVVLARAPAFTMPLYLGVGARVLDHHFRYHAGGVIYDDHDTRLGVRGPIGLLMDFNRVPIDIYLELALVIDLVVFNRDYVGDPYCDRYYYDCYDRVTWNAGVGVRYYF